MLSPLLCLTLCDPMDCSPPDSSVHGISQAKILEWVTISCSRESSGPRWFLYHSSHLGTDLPVSISSPGAGGPLAIRPNFVCGTSSCAFCPRTLSPSPSRKLQGHNCKRKFYLPSPSESSSLLALFLSQISPNKLYWSFISNDELWEEVLNSNKLCQDFFVTQ